MWDLPVQSKDSFSSTVKLFFILGDVPVFALEHPDADNSSEKSDFA